MDPSSSPRTRLPGPGRQESSSLGRRTASAGLAGAALLIAICATAGIAQSLEGRVEGTVTTTEGPPLANARVMIVGSGLGTSTGRDGRFVLGTVPPGRRLIQVSFIGRETATAEVEVVAGETQRVTFLLAVEAVPLPAVEVFSRAREMEGFALRRAGGGGFFFTAEEIVAMQARAFTDILRRVPGATVQNLPGGYGGRQAVQMGRTIGIAGPRPCEAIYFVNGQIFPISTDLGINGFIRPDEVAAVEVYTGSARIPPRFAAAPNSRCGVIVVWTHDGPPA